MVPEPMIAQQTQPSEQERWVEIRQVIGNVTYKGRPAQEDDRLEVGEVLTTDDDSIAVLVVDDGISTITVSERTQVKLSNLEQLFSGAKTTHFFVKQGQIRANTRKFTHPNSSFEIAFRGEDDEVEGGIAGTRGTDFGVAVGPTGKTGVSTRQGTVALTALEQTVLVEEGNSSLVVPGEPPTPPRSTNTNSQLKLQVLSATEEQNVRVVAEVDPLSLVFLNGQAVETDQRGQLETVVPIPDNSVIRLVVRSPLGTQQVYELDLNSLL